MTQSDQAQIEICSPGRRPRRQLPLTFRLLMAALLAALLAVGASYTLRTLNL